MKAHLNGTGKMRISACAIVKNEAHVIKRCINSYKDFVDEIVIVDTGSTDHTPELARKLGAKVLTFQWEDDFSAAKNYALENVSGDWVVFLDADEYFSENCAKQVLEAISEAQAKGYNAVGCRMENFDSDTGKLANEIYTVRILKKGFKYKYPVHETPFREDGLNIITADKSWFHIIHTGYSSKQIKNKCERNLELLLSSLETESDPNRRTSYYSYISDSYYGMGEYEKAIDYAKKFLQLNAGTKSVLIGCEIRPYLNIIHGLEFEQPFSSEITFWVKEFLNAFPDCPDAFYAEGRDYMRRHIYMRAVECFDRAIDLSKNFSGTYSNSVMVSQPLIYGMYAYCYDGMMDIPNALDWYYRQISADGSVQFAVYSLMRLVKGMPEDDINQLVDSLYANAGKEKHLKVMSGLMVSYMPVQLLRCYASYKKKYNFKALDSNVAAFLYAAKGEYADASKMFLLNRDSGDNDILTRGLICAYLSKDNTLIKNAVSYCQGGYALLLGISPKAEVPTKDEAVNLIMECYSMAGAGFSCEIAENAAAVFDEAEKLYIAKKLLGQAGFDPALAILQSCGADAETAFITGYALYRQRKFQLAAVIMKLARSRGYDKEACAAVLENIRGCLNSQKRDSGEHEARLKNLIISAADSGEFKIADQYLSEYNQYFESDEGISSVQAAVCFYLGRYNMAALSVEAAMLKYNSMDLYFNAGCIYEKLGDFKKADAMYKSAYSLCNDKAMAAEIQSAIGCIAAKSTV